MEWRLNIQNFLQQLFLVRWLAYRSTSNIWCLVDLFNCIDKTLWLSIMTGPQCINLLSYILFISRHYNGTLPTKILNKNMKWRVRYHNEINLLGWLLDFQVYVCLPGTYFTLPNENLVPLSFSILTILHQRHQQFCKVSRGLWEMLCDVAWLLSATHPHLSPASEEVGSSYTATEGGCRSPSFLGHLELCWSHSGLSPTCLRLP